jgi:hypothetical protein
VATKIRPKGEALPFGIFAGISLLGFFMSFGIRGERLEDDDWSVESEDEDEVWPHTEVVLVQMYIPAKV